jgi:hypothetical protein
MPSDEFKKNTLENNSSLTIILLNLISLCIFLGVLITTSHDRSWMHNAFNYLSFYIILALSAAWAASLINLYRYKQYNALTFIHRHWRGILASFLLTTVVFVSVPHYFRVLSDETNLLSVAKSMTFNKHVENITEGRGYYEMFWPTPTTGLEKRPFLFPFFVSLTHTLLGYHVENVFILNYFTLWAMLFLLYMVIQSSLGDIWAISGIILVMAQPFISLSATSGSYEAFNFLFIMASFLALRCFLNDPSHKTFITLVLTLIMLANVRYESILFLVITIGIVSIAGYVKPKFFSRSFSYGLACFFMLPWIWQRILLASESDPNLVKGSWINAFRFENAQQNIVLFFKYILQASGQLGYAGVINIAGILAIVLLGALSLRAKRSPASCILQESSGATSPTAALRSTSRNDVCMKNGLVLWICCVTGLVVLFTIVMFYQGGINDHPLNGRFYIPVLVPISIAPVYFLANILKDKQKLAIPTLICSLIAFAFYHPVAVEDRLTNTLMIIREYRYVEDFLKKNADKNTLIVWGRPGELIVSNYGAISYGTANEQADLILEQFKNHLYSKIYVIQSIAYTNKAPLNDNVINPRFQLETVDELQITGGYYFRISRVKVPE